jgi:hypothetical protein
MLFNVMLKWQASLLISKHSLSTMMQLPAFQKVSFELLRLPAYWGFLIPFLAQFCFFFNRHPIVNVVEEKTSAKTKRIRRFVTFSLQCTSYLQAFSHFLLFFFLVPNTKDSLINTIHGTLTQHFLYRNELQATPFYFLRVLRRARFFPQVRLCFRVVQQKNDTVWLRRDLFRLAGLPLRPRRALYIVNL